MKNNNGEGRGALINFLSLKKGGGELNKEGGLRGGFTEDLRYYKRIEKTLNKIPTP